MQAHHTAQGLLPVTQGHDCLTAAASGSKLISVAAAVLMLQVQAAFQPFKQAFEVRQHWLNEGYRSACSDVQIEDPAVAS